MPEQHQHADRILQRLQQEQIRAFYHFTSIENLPSIRDTQALCSKELLEEEGRWPVPEPGGNPLSHYLNNINENWDLISLNFTHAHLWLIGKSLKAIFASRKCEPQVWE